MADYEVTWKINIEADSAEDAARQALEIHRDPESLATSFKTRVAFPDGALLDTGTIDLGHQPMVRCDQHFSALVVCNRLIEAYAKADEENGGVGSVDWDDIDSARNMAYEISDPSVVEEIEQNVREDQLGE